MAGFVPWTADLFADVDLRAIVPDAIRCPLDQYPGGFESILRNSPQAPWIYTGGLENHPKLVSELASIRPLWGVDREGLRLSKSPFRIAKLLCDAGLPADGASTRRRIADGLSLAAQADSRIGRAGDRICGSIACSRPGVVLPAIHGRHSDVGGVRASAATLAFSA